ncbi:hypothetical protein U9M48_014858 [Paspalum notatum var. saurae]|uniref:Uncharacterized protein n=1 Tax=Paspalum notatum var. saurae TaxID=547442 RepID=A0AAQ3T2X0_PASNO
MPLHLEARMVRDALAEHVVALCGRCRAAVTPPPSPFLPYPPRLLLPYPLRPAESRPLPPHAMSARLPHRRVSYLLTDRWYHDTPQASPNGRFIAAAAFTADVKDQRPLAGYFLQLFFYFIWVVNAMGLLSLKVYSKDSSVKEINKVLQLKGHKWLFVETGAVLDTAEKAHEGDIDGIAWPPWTIPNAINRGFSMCHNAPLDR